MGPDPYGSDSELIQATLMGDATAYRVLVERHQRRIHRFLLKHVFRADDAQDLTQETFLQAYRSLRSYQGGGLFSTWLIGIALNIARNHHNRSGFTVAAGDGDDELENMPAGSVDPIDAVENASLLYALQRAIIQLPPEQRECITLIALEGLSYDEASRVLGVPGGTIKSRLSRARSKLAELLKDR